MRKLEIKRILSILLVLVMVINGCFVYVPSAFKSYAYTERLASVNASVLNVRSGPGTSYSLVTKLNQGASVTVTGESYASDGALWYQIRFSGLNGATVTGYVSKSYLKFPSAYTNDGDFEAHLSSEGFPESYKVKLRQLHAEHPQWVFRAQQTGLDWNTVIENESQVGVNLVAKNSISSWKSTQAGAYDWNTSTWPVFDGGTWAAASPEIVSYYMDPRNFLDDVNVFQFLLQSYNGASQTADGLRTMVKDTFLDGSIQSGGASSPGGSPSGPGSSQNYGPGYVNSGPGVQSGDSPSAPGSGNETGGPSEGPGTSGQEPEVKLEGPHASISKNETDVLASSIGPGMTGPSSPGGEAPVTGSVSYIDMIMNAGAQSGVNPYVLAAMIIQEQGRSGGSKSITGTEPGYEGYYNFFNIEAYQSGSMMPTQRGLWFASQPGSYGRPWDSAEKSILGGASYYGSNYVKVGQDTFYLKKFNVQGNNLYKHQYMTNIQAAAAEGVSYSKAYSDEMKKTALEFKIPVYNNMPAEPCGLPIVDGSPNNKLSSLGVSGFTLTPTFNKDIQEYDLIVDPSVGSITVNASAIDSSASVSGNGSVSLQSGNNDVRISVKAQNGSVREYTIHVVRQNEGPTYSDSQGGLAGPANGGATDPAGGPHGGSGAGPGSQGPGSTTPSDGGSQSGPGGSNVTIVPMASSPQSSPSPVPPALKAPAAAMEEITGNSRRAGDLDGNGKIDSLDALKLKQYLLNLDSIAEDSLSAADMNGDGNIDSLDLLLIQRRILGIE